MSEQGREVAISVSNVRKTFKLPHEKQSSLKGLFLSSFKRKSYEVQKALQNVDFEIYKGEFFGIVGRNGSGKSTLLKCMAGVYEPDEGEIKINGSMVPFIELGVGFNPELSGRDNVYLNGALLGLSRKKIAGMYKEIVEFAELEKFMDQKLKNYSSGMQVRLAFSIAIRAHSDILLLDEVLAVGDAAFQQKCFDYFANLKREKRTIVFVSHSMSSVENFCDRALLLDDGKIQKIGPSSDIAAMYEEMFYQEEVQKQKSVRVQRGEKPETAGDIVKISDVKIIQAGKATTSVKALQDFEIRFGVKSSENLENANIRVNIKNRQGQVLIATDTRQALGDVKLKKGEPATLSFDMSNKLTNGFYSMVISGLDERDGEMKPLIHKRPFGEFSIHGIKDYKDSLTHPEVKVEITK